MYSDYDKLCDELEQEYNITAESSLSKAEEGSVLFFVKRDKENAKYDDILSMSKLKTLEYTLFRLMRDKLTNFALERSNLYSD